jgi:hypothetical protein
MAVVLEKRPDGQGMSVGVAGACAKKPAGVAVHVADSLRL